jgi:hypothetical protein
LELAQQASILACMGGRRNRSAAVAAVANPLPVWEQTASSVDVLAVEHPAKRRIRQANELADAMRQTGGKHRADVHQLRGYGTDWTIEVAIVPASGRTSHCA